MENFRFSYFLINVAAKNKILSASTSKIILLINFDF